jgi:hypothetical protein
LRLVRAAEAADETTRLRLLEQLGDAITQA